MGRPSIFSNDYKRIMRRRKIIFRISIVLVALAAVLFIYSKPTIPNLKKLAGNIKIHSNIKNNDSRENTAKNDKGASQNAGAQPESASTDAQVQTSAGEYLLKLSDTESITVTYEKSGSDIKITGIKPEGKDISFDIRDDGKAIVFDNPELGDIWVADATGALRKVTPDYYKQTGEGGRIFYKDEIMKRFSNSYVWAARPKFLKDGRIVYQSHLPWFTNIRYYYFWVVDGDGQNNKMVVNTKQTNPLSYNGFLDDGRLVVEYSGAKYALNVDLKRIEAIN